MLSTLNLKKATTEEWLAKNPILKIGDAGVDTTLNGIKLGDGKTKWIDLPWETQFFNTDLQQSKTPQIQLYKGYTSLKLAGLSDVNINELEDNHFIKYDAASGKWVNTALDSISNFKIDGSLLPDTSNAYDIGNAEKVWNNIYANNLVLGGVNYSSMLTDSIFSSANTWSAKNTFSADIDVSAIYTTRLKTKYDSSYGSHINHYYTDSNNTETLWLVDGYDNGLTNLGLIPAVNNAVLGTSSYKWDSIFVNDVYTDWIRPAAFSSSSSQVGIGEAASGGPSSNHPILKALSYSDNGTIYDVLIPGKVSGGVTSIGTDSAPWTVGYFGGLYANVLRPLDSGGAIGGSSKYYSDIYTSAVHLSSNVRMQTTASSQALELYWYDSDNSTSGAVQLVGSCLRTIVGGNADKTDLGNYLFGWKNAYVAEIIPNQTVGALRLNSQNQYYNTGLKIWCESNTTQRTWYVTPKVIAGGMPVFAPSIDNTIRLGNSDARWSVVFAATGTINTSDYSRKENIISLDSALEKLQALDVYSYTLKDSDYQCISYGIMAQDTLETNPEIIDVPENYQEGDGTLGVITNNVLFLAVKAIQELSEKVSILENKLKNLGI